MSDWPNWPQGLPRKIKLTRPREEYPELVIRAADLVVYQGIVIKHRTGIADRPVTEEENLDCRTLTPEQAGELVDG